MPREPVESTLLRAVGYDVPSSILEVELVEGGVVYDYFDVPYSVYAELMEAESRGAYYNEFIKDLYAFRKREPDGGRIADARRPEVAALGMLAARPRPDPAPLEPRAFPRQSRPGSRTWPRRPTGLEREIAAYRARLPEFLKEHEGEFVLIHGEDVLGFWPTFDEALEVGMDRLGQVPMLVKQVLAVEPVLFYSRSI